MKITLAAAAATVAVLSASVAVALGHRAAATAASLSPRAAAAPADDRIARGRYLVRTAGCNDCHTPQYMERAGDVPEAQWLTGAPVGFQGPWGTTYAANLRLALDALSEAQWLDRARAPMKPPMPWFNLRAMTDDDLLAIHAYVRALGPAGAPAPAYAPPGAAVDTPYFVFVPQNLPPAQAQAR